MSVSSSSVVEFREAVSGIVAAKDEIQQTEYENGIRTAFLDSFGLSEFRPVEQNKKNQSDLVVRKLNGEIGTIFEFKRDDLKSGIDVVSKHLMKENVSSSATGVVTNGRRFVILQILNGRVQRVSDFTLGDDFDADFISEQLDRYVFSQLYETLKYTRSLNNYLKYFVRVLPFAVAADKKPAHDLDDAHMELLREASFEPKSFQKSAKTVAGITRNIAPELGEIRYRQEIHHYYDDKDPSELLYRYEIKERYVDIISDIINFHDAESLIDMGLLENLSKEFFEGLAYFIENLAEEYRDVLWSRGLVFDGGIGDLSTVVAIICASVSGLFLITSGNVVGGLGFIFGALYAFDGWDQFNNAVEYLINMAESMDSSRLY